MRNLAIIPARSGSKGLPDKNIMTLCGKPMIAYTIDAAKQSGCFTDILVSTDSEKYAQVAQEYGAEVPFLRSKETSSDTAGSWDVIKEVLTGLKEMGREYDTVCLLQPTSPLRKAEDIQNAYRQFEEKSATTVVSVSEMGHPVEWSFELDETCSMEAYAKSPYSNMRRQELPVHYMENGAIFLTKTKVVLAGKSIYADGCYASIMSAERAYDIDNAMDFYVTEAIMKAGKENGK